jgi:hypothetical protein
MEKETELYLIKRINDLETQLSFYKGFYDGTFEKGKPFKAEDFVDTHKGYNAEMLLEKAEAFDYIQAVLGIEVSNWVDEKRYELSTRFTRVEISAEKFEELWKLISK